MEKKNIKNKVKGGVRKKTAASKKKKKQKDLYKQILGALKEKKLLKEYKEKLLDIKGTAGSLDNWRKHHLIQQDSDNSIFALDRWDASYIRVIFSIVFFVFFLWLFNNYVRCPVFFFKILVLLGSIFLSFLCTRTIKLSKPKSIWPHIILNTGIFVSILFWIEPIFKYAKFPTGYSLKDLHDGLALYIFKNGMPPISSFPPQGIDVPWILTDMNGVWSTYANAMHCVGAFFGNLGVPVMHMNLMALLLVGITLSYVTYLIMKQIFGNAILASIIGGLVTLTSFRIPMLYFISPPQAFSFFLVLPVVWALWFAIKNPSLGHNILVAAALGALAASYNGTIILFAGSLVFIGIFAYLFYKDRSWCVPWIWIGLVIVFEAALMAYSGLLVRLFCFTVFAGLIGFLFYKKNNIEWKWMGISIIGFLFIAFLGQGELYWINSFPKALIYDPPETSHFLTLFMRPIYLVVWLPALVFFFYKKVYRNPLGFIIMGFVLLFSLVLPYDWIIELKYDLSTFESHYDIPAGGLFGGAKHQLISRVALLQPFFYPIILGAWGLIFRKNAYKWVAGFVIVGVLCFSHFDLPFYKTNSLPHELVKTDRSKVPVFLSDYTICNPPDGWDYNFGEVVSWVDNNSLPQDKIFYMPIKKFYFNRYVWLPLYLEREVGSFKAINPNLAVDDFLKKGVDVEDLNSIVDHGYTKIIVDDPDVRTLALLNKTGSWIPVYSVDTHFVFQNVTEKISVPDPSEVLGEKVWNGTVEVGDKSSLKFLGKGWAWLETYQDRNFSKVIEKKAEVLLPIKNPADVKVDITLRKADSCEIQQMEVYVDGQKLGSFSLSNEWKKVSFTIPQDKLISGFNLLELQFSKLEAVEGDPTLMAAIVDRIEFGIPGKSKKIWGSKFDNINDVADWWVISGNWAWRDGVYVQQDAAAYDSISAFPAIMQKDIDVSFSFRSVSGKFGAGIFARLSNLPSKANSTMIRFDGSTSLVWGKFDQFDQFVGLGWKQVPAVDDGNWHRLRVEIIDVKAIVWLDGEKVAEFNTPVATGKIALTTSVSEVEFDDVFLISRT